MPAKIIIVYESKYGNTKVVAETIAQGMTEIEGTEVVVTELKKVDISKIRDYDAILVGSPNHIGGPTWGIKKFIGKLGKLSLEGKQFAAFDTYLGKSFEQAVKKMEKRINDKVSGSKLLAPGLSIRVKGMKGPIAEGELPKCRNFGNKIAAQIKV